MQTTSVSGMYRQAAAIPGATLGEPVSGALPVPRLDARQRQEVHEVQRRSELQQSQEVQGVGAGALTPAPEGKRVRAQTAGEFAPGQRGRLFELLQLLGEVLGEDVDLAAMVCALAGYAVIPPCAAAGKPSWSLPGMRAARSARERIAPPQGSVPCRQHRTCPVTARNPTGSGLPRRYWYCFCALLIKF